MVMRIGRWDASRRKRYGSPAARNMIGENGAWSWAVSRT